MKREILNIDAKVSMCCPGHDTFPNELYKTKRSVRARTRDIKKEHRYVRRHIKQQLHTSLSLV